MTTAPRTATGYEPALDWVPPARAAHIADAAAGTAADITLSPHRTQAWAADAVTAAPVLAAVHARLGPQIAVVEPTFLLRKLPGEFVVPPHQDGVSDSTELDPDRAVAVWFAVTDATTGNGCLQVVPGSHTGGYLPHERGADEQGRGAPLTLSAPPPDSAYEPVPLTAGQAVLMDVRLIHRSGANTTGASRIGLNVCYIAPGGVRLHRGTAPHLHPVSTGRPTP